MSFDVTKARSEADWFLEYPDEEDKRTVRFAMMMRAACNRIEALESELDNKTEALHATSRHEARVKELEAEVKAQHDEHIARYGQAIAAQERAEKAEAKILSLETKLANVHANHERCQEDLEDALTWIDRCVEQARRAEAAEAQVAMLRKALASIPKLDPSRPQRNEICRAALAKLEGET